MNELSKAKTSRGIISMRTVLSVRLLFGLYSNISAHAGLRVLARLYCICLAYTCIIWLLTALDEMRIPETSFMPLIYEFSFYVFVSVVTGENNFINFCKVIEQSDTEMGHNNLPLISSPVFYFFMTLVVYKIIHMCVFYVNQHVNMYLAVPLFILSTAADINCVIYLMPLDLLRSRLALLRHVFELNFKRDNGRSIDTNQQIKTLNDYLNLYRSMFDKFYATFWWAKPQILVKLALTLWIFLFKGQNVISSLKNGISVMEFVTNNMAVMIFSCVVACSPAVCGELVNREVDNLKVTVGNLLLLCEDEGELRAELELAGNYLDLRPSRITIYRCCVLDASLVMTFIGLCTSYLIVIIQITGVI